MSPCVALFYAPGLPAWTTVVQQATVDWWLIPPAFFVGWLIALLFRRRSAASRGRNDHVTPVIPAYRSALPSFRGELNRVRRYDRSLALIVLQLDEDLALGPSPVPDGMSARDAASAGQNRTIMRVMFWNVGYALRDLLRESDLAACDVSRMRYVVLLPEADQQEGLTMAERLAGQILEHLDVPLRTGVAAYRVDGLTVDDLVECATGKCEQVVVDYAQRPRLRSRGAILRVADPSS
jgi:hypothetical protein